jgi:hypothetical protein
MTLPTAESTEQAMRPHRLRFDGTINIPTVLTLLAMIGVSIASALGIYSSLSDRININASAIGLMQSEQIEAKASATQTRQDMKGDLLRMDGKLDRLLWDRGDRKGSAPDPVPGTYQ